MFEMMLKDYLIEFRYDLNKLKLLMLFIHYFNYIPIILITYYYNLNDFSHCFS